METQILYFIFSGIGLVFLLLSIFGGDVHTDINFDIGHDFDISNAEVSSDSPKLFSIRSIATFLLVFGVTGLLCIYNDKSILTQIISGFVASSIVTGLYFLVMRFMYSMQGDSSIEISNLIGKQGIVTTPTTSTGILQVKMMSQSGNEYTAREINNKPLKQNEIVKVVSISSGTLIVEK